MLTSVGLSTPGAAPLREGNSWEALPGGSGGISALRGREKELNGVARVLRDTRASGLAVRICIEGPPGAGREAFAAECLRAARALGLRSQGPLRCPGREHRLPALAGLCPTCRSGGPWTRVGNGPGARRRPPSDVGPCSASGRVWLRMYPPGAAASHAHPEERVHRVRLGPLPEEAVVQLAEDILAIPPGTSLLAFLGRAGGHPALVRELLIGLREEQSLVYRKGTADIRVDRLPVRVHTWVDGVVRSVRFPIDEFLTACASMGNQFESLEPVRRVMGMNGNRVEEMGRVAVELGFLGPDGPFRFQNPMMHEIFWSNIPRRFPALIRPAAQLVPPPRPSALDETRIDLTEQEKYLIKLTSEGFTNRQIANRLRISQHTVNYHLKKLFKKYGVNSRVRLVRKALPDTGFGPVGNGVR